MIDLLDILIEHTEIITLIFSGVVTISTVMYAILTWRLTTETIKMRKLQTTPKISIYLQTCRVGMGFIDLIIKNIGLGPAYNIRFEVLEEFDVREDRKLSDIDFIHEGISYMPPNYSLETYFLQLMGEQYKKLIDKAIKIKTVYEDSEGEKITEIINLNLSQFKGIQRLGEDPLNVIANNIKKYRQMLVSYLPGSIIYI